MQAHWKFHAKSMSGNKVTYVSDRLHLLCSTKNSLFVRWAAGVVAKAHAAALLAGHSLGLGVAHFIKISLSQFVDLQYTLNKNLPRHVWASSSGTFSRPSLHSALQLLGRILLLGFRCRAIPKNIFEPVRGLVSHFKPQTCQNMSGQAAAEASDGTEVIVAEACLPCRNCMSFSKRMIFSSASWGSCASSAEVLV